MTRRSRKRLAVLIPFRDRHEHLRTLLPVLGEHLRAIEHRVVVVEQADRRPFNKGTLLNVGVLLNPRCDYYCLHDVDLIPAWRPGPRSPYAFTRSAVHLAGRCEQFGYRMPYRTYFGGVLLFNRESFLAINGFSNEYRGWGGEDDDLHARARRAGLRVTFRACRYRSLPHDASYRCRHPHWLANRARRDRMARGEIDFLSEGLDSVTFTSVRRELRDEYDWIRVVS